MNNNLFQVLWATIKAKVTPVVTKIKLWTSWNFIRTRLISKIRDFFSSILNISPPFTSWIREIYIKERVSIMKLFLTFYSFTGCYTLRKDTRNDFPSVNFQNQRCHLSGRIEMRYPATSDNSA